MKFQNPSMHGSKVLCYASKSMQCENARSYKDFKALASIVFEILC